MTLLMVIACALSSFAQTKKSGPFDWGCESLLAPTPEGGRQVTASFIRLPSGSELFVRIERPAGREPRGWVLAIHGLLDSHRAFDALTAGLIAAGYGVVRPDLRGFGRSLHARHRTDGKIDYRDHVEDLIELMDLVRLRYHVLSPRLLGHSMGAGLLLALLARPDLGHRVAGRHVVISPYVYRTEMYLAKKMHLATLASFEPWIPPLLKVFPQIFADSVIDPQLRYGFGAYLKTARQVQDLDLNDYRVRRALEEQVDVAIGTVKGLRRLNSLNEVDRIPRGVAVDMAYGDRDAVVEPPQARELARRIKARGGRVVELHAEHAILTTHASELLRLIID